jgi:hypothetical protein
MEFIFRRGSYVIADEADFQVVIKRADDFLLGGLYFLR